ncbi:hypothetical protein NQ318_014685 [Aromia moschata]|uniref:RNA-directed DNA polymerase n=1 Tax=Aromia moschata TaxID=1265417 RepID=A0AAV8ZB24_9CUCU|nr:hypothetical protein NQ318_014685 [Aromia moschata]
MMVTKDIVIPPHHIGHVKFNSVEQYEGDLFVDFQARYKPLNEYLIPSCVVSSKDGTPPILNVSTNFIRFTAKDTIARGMPCVPESSISASKRSINQILGSLRFTTALAYMDDILLPSPTFEKGDWVLSTQLMDNRCKYLHEVLSERPKDKEEELIHKDYTLKNNRVYKNTNGGPKWVVPKNARRAVVAYYHDMAGHFALDKTLSSLSQQYWFPQMRKYVERYIHTCIMCAYNKEPAGKRPGVLHPIEKIATPMDTLHVDHLGPFVKSTRGNSYLIVAVDGFMKYVFAKAVASTKYLEHREELYVTKGHAIQEYTTKLNIKLTQNATATPRSNGQVERCNRTFLSGLTSTTDDESRWDQGIGRITFGINSTLCKSTGKTPHELMFGYCPRGINDSFLSYEVGNSEYSTTLSERREQAKQNIERDQVKQKKRYDSKRLVDIKYQVEQQALYNDGKSRKLLPKYAGPFIITAVLDKDRYVVEDLPGTNRSQKKYSGICAVDKLKPFHIRNDSDDESSEEQNVGQRENVSQEENVPQEQTLLSGKTFPERTLSSMSKRCSRGKRFPRGLCSSGANVAQRENVSQEENVPHEQTLLNGKTFPEGTLSSGANVAHRENVSQEESVPQEQTLLSGKTFPERTLSSISKRCSRGKRFPRGLCSSGANVPQRENVSQEENVPHEQTENVSQEENVPHEQTLLNGKTFPEGTLSSGANVAHRENVSQEESVPQEQTLLSGKTFPERTLSSISKRCSRGKCFPRGLCSSGANVPQRENVSQEENVPHEQTLLNGKTFPEGTLSSGANVAHRENVSQEENVPHEQTLLKAKTFPKRKTFLTSKRCSAGKRFPRGPCPP